MCATDNIRNNEQDKVPRELADVLLEISKSRQIQWDAAEKIEMEICKWKSGCQGQCKGESCTFSVPIVLSPYSTTMCFNNAFRNE